MAPTEKRCDNGGVELEYLLWAGTSSTLAPVLLVPGMAAPAGAWLEPPGFAELLSEGGTRSVMAVSLRGRGASACPERGWTPAHHQLDLVAVLQAEGVSRCHLVGHSVGGVYALGLAVMKPACVASVTMGDYPPGLPRYEQAWARQLEARPEKSFHPDFPRRIVAESEPMDYSAQLRHLQPPLLVLQGTRPGALLKPAHVLRFASARDVDVVQVDADHDVFASDRARAACAAFIRSAD
jgi:pimeloyl-ACP methyl ester carboxylesterase